MLKNARLSVKLSLGFGAVVIVAAIIGGVGWRGVDTISRKVVFSQQGSECLASMNECATLRRDFALRGNAAAEGEKGAGDKWVEAHARLIGQLDALAASKEAGQKHVDLIASAKTAAQSYKASFEAYAAARTEKDAAAAEWGRLGNEITGIIGKANDEVIHPALDAAKQAQDALALAHWSEVATTLDTEVISNFLLLRVAGVYYIAQNTEQRYEALKSQLALLQSGLATWRDVLEGDQQLAQAAKTIEEDLTLYAAAAEQFHAGVAEEQQTTAGMVAEAANLVNAMDSLQTLVRDDMDRTVSTTTTAALGLTVGGIALGMLLAFFITRIITKPINRAIEELSHGAEQMTAASNQVSESSQVMAEAASEQASSLEETSASLEELASMTRQNADNTDQANAMAKEASAACAEGTTAMERMGKAIEQIKKSSDETAKIIKTIDEIAFQTNLLALNAAVEAARAGEAGKGFAVVAEEVRNLAQRSAEAARNTSELIEGSQHNADNGVSASSEVGRVLARIADGVDRINQLIAEVSAASAEQSRGIDQINTAVTQMDQVTQSNAATSEEAASASEELAAQAVSLKDVVTSLAAIVGGRDAAISSSAPPQARAPQPRQKLHRPAAAPAPRKSLPASHGNGSGRRQAAPRPAQAKTATVIDPETVIPLDNDDLSDF